MITVRLKNSSYCKRVINGDDLLKIVVRVRFVCLLKVNLNELSKSGLANVKSTRLSAHLPLLLAFDDFVINLQNLMQHKNFETKLMNTKHNDQKREINTGLRLKLNQKRKMRTTSGTSLGRFAA